MASNGHTATAMGRAITPRQSLAMLDLLRELVAAQRARAADAARAIDEEEDDPAGAPELPIASLNEYLTDEYFAIVARTVDQVEATIREKGEG